MRVAVLLFFVTLFQVRAELSYSQATLISLNLKNATVEEVLTTIEEKSEFYFLYNTKLIDVDRKVDVDVKDKPIQTILHDLFDNTNVTYYVNDRQIVLSNTEVMQSRDSNDSRQLTQQPTRRLVGRVTDVSREGIVGVSISVKGTGIGTVSDTEGNFSIPIPETGGTLSINYIGYIPQEIRITNQSSVNVTMEEDIKALDEVVVIGYGTRVKGALTGSVSKSDSKIFETRPIADPLSALQGALPGVTVIRGSARPGYDQVSVQIRGYSSAGGFNQGGNVFQPKPLILIDGIAGDLNLINPADILDITVLKDAAASIYGARASDGVILVTTKKGKSGKPALSYSTNVGLKIPHFLKEMSPTYEVIDMFQEAMYNVGLPMASQEVVNKIKSRNAPPEPTGSWLYGYETFPAFYQDYDHTNDIIGSAWMQNHNMSLSGGSENMTYLFSAGYNRDEGVYQYGPKEHTDRYNIRLNNEFKNIFNRLDLETRIQYDIRKTNEPLQVDNVIQTLQRFWRFHPVYNREGNFYRWQSFTNPFFMLAEGGTRERDHDRFTFNAKANLRIIDDLKLVTQYGINMTGFEQRQQAPSAEAYDWNNNVNFILNNPNNAYVGSTYSRYSNYTAYLEYNKDIAKHQVNLMTGAAHEEYDTRNHNMTGYNFASNELFTMNLADRTRLDFFNIGGTASDWALTSFFGRVGYNFSRRYLVDFTLRADGSSKFAPGKRWSALFPAVSAGWNLSEENFIRSLNRFDQLKLRLSWGKSGNQELAFGNYDYISLINFANNAYVFGTGDIGVPGATATIASEARTWETILTYNAGLDFAFLNSKLYGTADVFIKRNSDMLVAQELPAALGGAAPTQNIGELETKGFDLTVGWRDKKGDFKYGISFMLSDNTNKLVSLKGSDTKAEGLVFAREGYSLYSYFGYDAVGIIQTEEQLAEYKKLGGTVPAQLGLGDMMYRDIDGDGKITAFGDDGNSGDLIYLGNRLPRYTYSSNLDLSYKNFDFSIFLQGVGKRNAVRVGNFYAPFTEVWWQPLAYFHEKTWTAERPDAEHPRIIPGSQGFNEVRNWNYRYSNSSHRLLSTAYMRVKLMTLAYNVPQTWCSKMSVGSLRLYVSGQDLFTFAKGTWGGAYDPEDGWLSDVNPGGSDITYPFCKVISFGLDIKF